MTMSAIEEAEIAASNADKRMTHEERMDALEAMVDGNHLANVLDALAEVCHAKAEHLGHNWQDEEAMAAWDGAAVKIEKLSAITDYPFMIL